VQFTEVIRAATVQVAAEEQAVSTGVTMKEAAAAKAAGVGC
jgi:hypothetical protein